MKDIELNDMYKDVFPFWDGLSEEDRAYICSTTQYLWYDKSKNIHNGNKCTGAFVVKSGCLRVYIMSDDGREVTLYRLYSGDMCMLSASCVIQAITFDVFVDAEENTECLLINASVYNSICEKYTDMKIYTLELAVSRFSDVMWSVQELLFKSLDKRLASFLWDETRRSGSDTLKMTHEQIAKYMNSAREVVSRMLKYFASEKIVELSRGGLKIIDSEKLRELAF